jgi:hypothetical protein
MVVDEKSVVTDYRFEMKERDALRVPLFFVEKRSMPRPNGRWAAATGIFRFS